MTNFTSDHHYHFIGIGGVGMGALAVLALAEGRRVTGSDLKTNAMTEFLTRQGAEIMTGHAAGHVGDADLVIYSSAVRPGNPELAEARRRAVPVLRRGELLARMMQGHRSAITVAGAHGKTTTSSMAACVLMEAGLDPTVAVGAMADQTRPQARRGNGNLFVAEADESDGSFLELHPRISIVTNIDLEHVDYYGTWERVINAYRRFLCQTQPGGQIIVCGDDERLQDLAREPKVPVTTFGFSPECDLRAGGIVLDGLSSRFPCSWRGSELGEIELSVPGRYNVLNALAAAALGLHLSVPFAVIQKALGTFRPVKRRFEIKGRAAGVTVVDDYGHHPTEIREVLTAAQGFKTNRLITVFQPHRFSRTQHLFDEFVQVLPDCDELIITDIYAASEEPVEEVSAENLVRALQASGCQHCRYLPRDQVADHLCGRVTDGDLVLTLGAGDNHLTGTELLERLNAG